MNANKTIRRSAEVQLTLNEFDKLWLDDGVEADPLDITSDMEERAEHPELNDFFLSSLGR